MYSQPVNHPVMGAVEQKLIHNPINPHCATDQLQCRIIRIAEDEVITVKAGQVLPANTTSQRRHVVDIGLLYHCRHGALDVTVCKLEARVLIPDGFEVEVGAAQKGLEEGEGASVC
jgi:hypothetical protein